MRLWSIHPRLLDRMGLLACWREGLLAKAVLEGKTVGYQHHPQLIRFRESPEPLRAINLYLHALADEADNRGYRFDRTKLTPASETIPNRIPVTDSQLKYEYQRLINKVQTRDPFWFFKISTVAMPEPHPLFCVIPGKIALWERPPHLLEK